jgi:hypothetical protein
MLAAIVLGLLAVCLAIPFLFLVLALSVCAAPILLVIFLFRVSGPKAREQQRANEEEVRFIQGFNASLAEMERRIDTLETILLDRVDVRRSLR